MQGHSMCKPWSVHTSAGRLTVFPATVSDTDSHPSSTFCPQQRFYLFIFFGSVYFRSKILNLKQQFILFGAQIIEVSEMGEGQAPFSPSLKVTNGCKIFPRNSLVIF